MDTTNNIKLIWFRDPIYQKSLKKLSNQDSKNVIIKMNSIENNQKGKAIKWERIRKSRDKNFWSLRINRDIRVIVHKTNILIKVRPKLPLPLNMIYLFISSRHFCRHLKL